MASPLPIFYRGAHYYLIELEFIFKKNKSWQEFEWEAKPMELHRNILIMTQHAHKIQTININYQIYQMLGHKLAYHMSFNILNAIRDIKGGLTAPIKHIKALVEPTGQHYNPQTNTTVEAFDQVAHQWQAHLGNNPFDMQTYNYLQNAQLTNFGTVDNPLVIFTADAPFRYVGCSGPQNQDDYESHELFWMMIRQGPLQRCGVCGQVFKLVRLRDEFSSEMDYYMPNFNQLWFQEMGEHDTTNVLSLSKANTHYEHTNFEVPEDNAYSLVNPDEHDRILTDPAYRLQRQAEGDLRARVYMQAMDQYESRKWAENKYRTPISKRDYENLIEAEATIKKYDRLFRKVAKFHSRKYVDFQNHQRREKRMLERAKKRWDNSYTIYSGELTEQEQKYRDYFQTDLEQYRQDERIEQFLDRQQLLGSQRYSLNKFDFQQGYTTNAEDDHQSYIERRIFKFKYRRALDSHSDYQRRNQRMVERQRERFSKADNELVQNYLTNPTLYQQQYLDLVEREAVSQYQDYFETDRDQFEDKMLTINKSSVGTVFENWQLAKQDRSSYLTLPAPKWNEKVGVWANAVSILLEVANVRDNLEYLERRPNKDITEKQ